MRFSTAHGLDERGIKPLAQRGNQPPCAAIAHLHLPGGRADGNQLTEIFQKAYLAHADGAFGNKPFGLPPVELGFVPSDAFIPIVRLTDMSQFT